MFKQMSTFNVLLKNICRLKTQDLFKIQIFLYFSEALST